MLFYLTILGFLITFLIVLNLRTSNKANLYLFFFLFINNIYSLSHYAALNSGNKYFIAVMLVHFTPFYLLLGPFFYFYVRGLVYDDHKLYKKDIIHFIPAILILINISPYLFFSVDQKLMYAAGVIKNPANIFNFKFLFLSPTISFISRPIFAISYVILSASLIYKKGLNENYKDMQPKLIYRWLISLIAMALLLYFTFFLFSIIGSKTWRCQLTFSAGGSSTGAYNGSGDYLFTLPNGLQFNTSIAGQAAYSANVGQSIWDWPGLWLSSSSGSITNLSQGGLLYVVPYSNTQYRLIHVGIAGVGAVIPYASGYYGVGSNISWRLTFTFQSL